MQHTLILRLAHSEIHMHAQRIHFIAHTHTCTWLSHTHTCSGALAHTQYTTTHILCTHAHIHTHTDALNPHTITQSHTHSHTTHTQPAALSASLTLSSTHTHRTHSIIQGSFSWFFTSLLQCWSRRGEDCSFIQEQYLLGVWRREASRGLWLNAWYGINAPRNEGRSSCQDHAHQESHVFRFKIMQFITPFMNACITSFMNAFIRQTIYAYWNAMSRYNLKLTCEYECYLWSAYDSSVTCGYRDVLVNMCLENCITTREFF